MSTLPHTSTAVLLFYFLEGCFDLIVDVEAYLIYKLIESAAVESCFYF